MEDTTKCKIDGKDALIKALQHWDELADSQFGPGGEIPLNATANTSKKTVGVGMPAALYLNEFGSQIWHAFGKPPYLVGSALTGATWRDVDVRVLLDDADYAAMGFGNPDNAHQNGRWCAFCMAFSALGKQMTGLPIDFQIQQVSAANKAYDAPRSALGTVELRFAPECPN